MYIECVYRISILATTWSKHFYYFSKLCVRTILKKLRELKETLIYLQKRTLIELNSNKNTFCLNEFLYKRIFITMLIRQYKNKLELN